MAMPVKDMTGMKFGFLTALERVGSTKGTARLALWRCRCDCGVEVIRIGANLRKNNRPLGKHCGCRSSSYNRTHGMTKTRPFRIWTHMVRRCFSETFKDYKNYGARGITVCKRWQDSFEAFWEDMEEGYSPTLTLGRVDNDGPYSPENCRWETVKQQSNNKRGSIRVQTPSGEMTIAEAAKAYGLKEVTLHARLYRYKWPVEKALNAPLFGRNYQSTTS